MRFVVERDVAVEAFKKASRLRAPSLLVPNLDKVMVKATDEGLEIFATNIAQIVRIDVSSADVSEEGTAIFPKPMDMVQFLSVLPDGDVTFDVSDTTLLVSSGKAKTTRQLVPIKSYPALPDLDVVKTWHEIPAGLLASDIKAVLPAADRAGTPHFMQVVVTDKVFYGSDGLSAHVQQVSGYECPDLSISTSAMALLKALVFSTENEYVEIGLAKSAVLFRVNGLTLLTYAPTTEMPDVNKAIVSAALNNDQILEVDRDELRRAVAQVSGTVDNFSAVHIFAAKSGNIVLRSKSNNGQTETQITGTFEHPDQEVILSAGALVAALSVYPQQMCKIFLGSQPNKAGAKTISPVRVSSNEGEGGSFVAVLSQLRKDLL